MFFKLVRLSYGPWRHRQPPCKSALLCQMVDPFCLLPSIQLFWASVLLGKLGKWTHNCAHIFSKDGRKAVAPACAQDKQNAKWKLSRPNRAAAAAGSLNSSWLRQFNSISRAPGNSPQWFVLVLFTYFIWGKSCVDLVPVLFFTLVHPSCLTVFWLI